MFQAHVAGVGLAGPGLHGWKESIGIVTGDRHHAGDSSCPDLNLSLLPANERRRCERAIAMAVHVAQEAMDAAGLPAEEVPSVFATSEGTAEAIHAICTSLAEGKRLVSPFKFHNSVFNAAASYWTIGSRCSATTNTVCCHDASFAAGLIEAMSQMFVEEQPILMVAFDVRLPEPLHAQRHFEADFACAFVLSPPSPSPRIKLSLGFCPKGSCPAPTIMGRESLERLRLGNPAARSLPLLSAIAARKPASVILDAFQEGRLRVDVTPC
jgi:hypothetical protein